MLARRSYVIGWNGGDRRWQIRTTTGFVLLESDSRREAAVLCARLNRRFPARRPGLPGTAVARATARQVRQCEQGTNLVSDLLATGR